MPTVIFNSYVVIHNLDYAFSQTCSFSCLLWLSRYNPATKAATPGWLSSSLAPVSTQLLSSTLVLPPQYFFNRLPPFDQ